MKTAYVFITVTLFGLLLSSFLVSVSASACIGAGPGVKCQPDANEEQSDFSTGLENLKKAVKQLSDAAGKTTSESAKTAQRKMKEDLDATLKKLNEVSYSISKNGEAAHEKTNAKLSEILQKIGGQIAHMGEILKSDEEQTEEKK